MPCTRYREAIHELVDGTLGPVRRAELQTHLDTCDACRALVSDLQKIRRAASSLAAVQPRDHRGLQIAARLRQEGRVTDTGVSRPRHMAMLALAATLLLAVAGSLYMIRTAPLTPPAGTDAARSGTPVPGNAATSDTVQSITDDLMVAEQHYQSAIAKLQAVAKTDGAFDPETAAVLEKNLQVIDRAIVESRTALKSEPQSTPARDSLFEALRQKVVLLQNTIALMNEMRKGNSAGAAQLVDGANKS